VGSAKGERETNSSDERRDDFGEAQGKKASFRNSTTKKQDWFRDELLQSLDSSRIPSPSTPFHPPLRRLSLSRLVHLPRLTSSFARAATWAYQDYGNTSKTQKL
jgi:hypothetical protein